MEVENISTSMACPRAPKRTESLVLSQVRSARAAKISVMENRLKKRLNCRFVWLRIRLESVQSLCINREYAYKAFSCFVLVQYFKKAYSSFVLVKYA